jgi:hypothetical protein
VGAKWESGEFMLADDDLVFGPDTHFAPSFDLDAFAAGFEPLTSVLAPTKAGRC